MEPNKKNQITEKDFLILIGIVSVIVVGYFLYTTLTPVYVIPTYKLEFIEITADCDECFDFTTLKSDIEKQNVEMNSKSIDYLSEEAQELIKEYSIEKIPAIVIKSKKIENIKPLIPKIESFKEYKNTLVFSESVPYTDVKTGELKGLITPISVYDSACKECASPYKQKTQLEQLGLKFNELVTLDISSEQGKSLLKEYNITSIPVIILSKDFEEYWWLTEGLEKYFEKIEDSYVLRVPPYPYKDISSKKIIGNVKVTYLVNESCKECFDVKQFSKSFQQVGVAVSSENSIDISSAKGKELINKYNIAAVPTFILSKDIQDYESLKQTFENIGTFESDGSYVLRNLEQLNVNYQKI